MRREKTESGKLSDRIHNSGELLAKHMSFGSINVKLRPIKLAFLVRPGDRAGLLDTIRINTFLWGGVFNPIILDYSRVPKNWDRHPHPRTNASAVISGYIDAYDPDFLVLVGKARKPSFDLQGREVISSHEILASAEEDGNPAYGIGLFEILRRFYHEELRFVRHQPLEIVALDLDTTFKEFLASVFGDLPRNLARIFTTNFVGPLGAQSAACTLQNYPEFLDPNKLFLRRFAILFLDVQQNRWRKGDCIFFLDASNMLDIVDYWNLRAVGWIVVPIPKQTAHIPAVRKMAEDFIEENFAPYRDNPNIYHSTTLLKARSVADTEFEQFFKSLKLKPTPTPQTAKLTFQLWYPRIWDEWARDKDQVLRCEVSADSIQKDLSDEVDRVTLRTVDPKVDVRFGGHGKPRFANEIGVRIYGSKQLLAEALPQGEPHLARAFQVIDSGDWRLSQNGLVYLSHHFNWNLHLSPASAEEVLRRWLESKGWNIESSSPGLLAKQILKQLGGVWGISRIANEELVKLLGEMSDGKSISKNGFWGRIRKVANAEKYCKDPRAILKSLMDAQVFQIGLSVQCPVCQQHSWYSVTDSGYTLQCPKCSEGFPLPSHSPNEMQWAYRTLGPFSLPGQCYGTYAVLLTLRFFSQLMDAATTPMLSFRAKKDTVDIEVDLALFFKESRFAASEKTEFAICECKTFDTFRKKDMERMLILADNFPGAFLVFATLRKTLEPREKRLIARIANRGRRYWKAERPYNPVLVLTGNELLADWHPDSAWRDLGGKHAQLAQQVYRSGGLLPISDATQQLYLDLQPWHEWLREMWAKKRGKQGLLPSIPSSQAAP